MQNKNNINNETLLIFVGSTKTRKKQRMVVGLDGGENPFGSAGRSSKLRHLRRSDFNSPKGTLQSCSDARRK